MARKQLRRALIAAIPLTLAVAVTPAGAAVTNGDFELGTLSDWSTHTLREVEGTGGWFAYSGSTAPLSGEAIQSPPEGTFAATTDSFGGPGTHILYRDLALPADTQNMLGFTLYYDNQHGSFATPNSLNYEGAANQQLRVDVIKPGASIMTLSSGDILASVFRTGTSDPATMDPRRFTVDLTPFAGQTVRLRFAEVDNQFFFFAGVDNLTLFEQAETVTVANPVIAEVLPDLQANLKFSAQLTSEGAPVVDELIAFKIGNTVVCSAVTGGDGVAACGEPAQELDAVLAGGYQAVFAGTEVLLPSQDRGAILSFSGSDI